MEKKTNLISKTQTSPKPKKPVKIGISKPITDDKKTYVK